jgi:hypothetical protein
MEAFCTCECQQNSILFLQTFYVMKNTLLFVIASVNAASVEGKM